MAIDTLGFRDRISNRSNMNVQRFLLLSSKQQKQYGTIALQTLPLLDWYVLSQWKYTKGEATFIGLAGLYVCYEKHKSKSNTMEMQYGF